MQIEIPPIELQNQFADIVKQIDKQKFEIQKSLEETENKMDQWIWAEIFGAAGILILLWYGWRMKRTGKRRK